MFHAVIYLIIFVMVMVFQYYLGGWSLVKFSAAVAACIFVGIFVGSFIDEDYGWVLVLILLGFLGKLKLHRGID